MQVYFENFPKKRNSTAFPAEFGIEKDCKLKETTSLLNPVLIVSDFSPVSINYAYIPSFSRYYFVDDWTYNRGYWECSLSVDVLATYKAEIGESTQYIARSSYARNPRLNDDIYPVEANATVITNNYDFDEWGYSFAGGSYVIGFITSNSSGIGAVEYYSFTNAQFRYFCNQLLSNTDWLGDITDISQNLLKTLFNPMQYIASCLWFPFSVTGTNVSSITLGWNWSLNAPCQRLSGSMMQDYYKIIEIPKHPQSTSNTLYLRSAPYSAYYLNVPPFGGYTIDADKAGFVSSIVVNVFADLVTGQARLHVYSNAASSEQMFNFVNTVTQLAIPITIAQIATENRIPISGGSVTDLLPATNSTSEFTTPDFGDKITGYISKALSKVMGVFDAPVKAAQTRLVNNLSPITKYMGSNVTMLGSTGSLAGLYNMTLMSVFQNQTDHNNAMLGSPLYQTRQISRIPGYIKCARVELELPAATDTECNSVESAMMQGFHYE